jgi:hypothetical protein
LEFEKACRGTRDPVPNEYAWGSTYFLSSALSWAAGTVGRPNERPSTVGANHIGNAAQGWVTRNGAFANDSSGRVVSGATYYGIMEMSTNLREITVSVINASGRAYTGEHGDGRLTDGGSQNVTGWPDYFGFGWRGSYTIAIDANSEHRVSDRRQGWWNSAPTNVTNSGGNSWALGGRGVRTMED